jgi:ribosome-associated toxin RatA of RatAB toxin-antitoxin module
MITQNEVRIDAAPQRCFRVAADVERWPDFLKHYRWVRFLRRDAFGKGLVEMAANRMFGPLGYPVWWVSEMDADERVPVVRYRHVQGITRGMDVEWRFHADGAGTRVEIVHDWPAGPRWPLGIGAVAAGRVIGPVFIHHVAGMTLAGVKLRVEAK